MGGGGGGGGGGAKVCILGAKEKFNPSKGIKTKLIFVTAQVCTHARTHARTTHARTHARTLTRAHSRTLTRTHPPRLPHSHARFVEA